MPPLRPRVERPGRRRDRVGLNRPAPGRKTHYLAAFRLPGTAVGIGDEPERGRTPVRWSSEPDSGSIGQSSSLLSGPRSQWSVPKLEQVFDGRRRPTFPAPSGYRYRTCKTPLARLVQEAKEYPQRPLVPVDAGAVGAQCSVFDITSVLDEGCDRLPVPVVDVSCRQLLSPSREFPPRPVGPSTRHLCRACIWGVCEPK